MKLIVLYEKCKYYFNVVWSVVCNVIIFWLICCIVIFGFNWILIVCVIVLFKVL